MKFTVVFASNESADLSYTLVFTPCPVWVRGERKIANLNPQDPHYRAGGVRQLFATERIGPKGWIGRPGACTVVVHPEGHGDWPDLQALVADLRSEGLRVTLAGEVA